jgi:protein-S-isoprenylcysteine O-methyltransferase Ste14
MNNNIRLKAIKLVISRLIIGIPILFLILFLPAWTINYLEGWIFLAILLIPMTFVMIYFLNKKPEFLIRRMKFREKEEAQKKIIALGYLPILIQFILPGIDKRMGWSNIPLSIEVSADLIVLAGYLMIFWVFKENEFASRIIEVDEKQEVIQTGPYRIVRHPMYLGTMVMYFTAPIALGSYWALIPALLIIPILIARIVNEEKVLEKELLGYSEFQKKTKYRIIPGVW